MNRDALTRFSDWQQNRRMIIRFGLGMGLFVSLWLGYMIYFVQLPDIHRLTKEIDAGNLAVSDIDQLKQKAKQAERQFNAHRHQQAQQKLFDDVDAVSTFINVASESFKQHGFIVHTNVQHMMGYLKNPKQELGKDIHWIRVDFSLRNPGSLAKPYTKLMDTIRRIPVLGRKVDIESLHILGTSHGFANVDLRLVLWSSFPYAKR